MVTLEQLAAAVSKMRKAQQDFFTYKGNRRLNEAKEAEREVDRLLALLAPVNVDVRNNLTTQTSLFG